MHKAISNYAEKLNFLTFSYAKLSEICFDSIFYSSGLWACLTRCYCLKIFTLRFRVRMFLHIISAVGLGDLYLWNPRLYDYGYESCSIMF